MTADSWSNYIAPFPMRLEAHPTGRIVRCFVPRAATLYQRFDVAAHENWQREALVCGTQRITYQMLHQLVAEWSSKLRTLGIVRGDRVAVLLGNRIEYVVVTLALAKLGAMIVPLNIRETAHELEFILNDCEAKAIIVETAHVDQLPAGERLPALRHTIHLGSESDTVATDVAPDSNTASTDDVVNEDDIAAIIYTSGTTGRPKGAMVSHCNIVHSVMHYHLAMSMNSQDRSIIAVPMSHVTGLVALVAAVIGAGATLIIMREFKAKDFMDLAAKERMTHTLLVPAMFNLCLLQPNAAGIDLTAWRVAGYGGAIMPEATLSRIGALWPELALVNCYGATETTSPAAMMPPRFARERIRDVGLAVPCGEIAIMNEAGHEAAAGETGEIWISGPMVVRGYWNNPKATQSEFIGGFWRSGDVGSMDEKGFLRVIDRIKDLINRGGYKIYASEVENVLLEFAGVVEVAVIPWPCPVLGERVHAHIVVNHQIDPEELKRYCAVRLAEYKVPEVITFVDTLPRNANGKVLKRQLIAGSRAQP